MSQWVQYKNDPNGKKWEVEVEWDDYYAVKVISHGVLAIRNLPKDEYIPCDPPERWEVCTRDRVGLSENGAVLVAGRLPVHVSAGYRWAWSEKDPDALIIQRRVRP